ncbi:transcription factor Ken-like [Euwallacea fornicatus]|uniref:transcription factor Ken-like n=1 Tax=Euwallacea fornicatus TaxID=995702 RepID=UPI00338F2F35
MELKEPVIMDVSDTFRSSDQEMSKTDFFDFVVNPDTNDPQTIQQFAKQMRSVNVFLNNGTDEDHHTRETNNNNMIISDVPTTTSDSTTIANFDTNLWNEKDTVKIETAILEDLNKYCWTNDEVNGVVQIKQQGGSSNSNTDGQIYTTLTVLNGLEQTPSTWYRQPLTIKEEDVSMSSPSEIDQHLQGGGLDIDSILSIMPGPINAFYGEGTMSPNTDGLIKSETFTYEDSGFADNKEELANCLIINTPLLEAHDNFNNNNNDWKLTNNNTQSESADSLLRSALQGKAFVRYNGAVKSGAKVAESNVELRRCLSESPTKTETIYIAKEEPETQLTTIVSDIDANGKVVFKEEPQADNPSSTHNVDDLLLSQLDHPYSEDFEKLKRIANEVAESVNQYCIDTSSTSDNQVQASISSEQIGILYNITSPIQITAPLVTSTKTTKKYKRLNNTSKNQANLQSATSTSNGVRKERSLHYCSICSKGFKDKYSVNVHIRTHTGEKPFACTLCGKTFRQKAHLAKHYQTHIAQKNAAAAGNVSSTKSKSR